MNRFEQLLLSGNSSKELQQYAWDLRKKGQKVGKGALGEVYQVEVPHKSFANVQTKFAEKVMEWSVHQEEEEVIEKQKLIAEREATILKQLNHPNVISLFHYQILSNGICFIMELMDSDAYFYLNLLEKSSLSLREKNLEKYLLLFCIAKGLQYLHKQSVLHRDVKLQNILVNYDKTTLQLTSVKVTDFGASKVIDAEAYSHSIAGTFLYMAPEIRNFSDVNASLRYELPVDIYSFGKVFQEILMGKTISLAKVEFSKQELEANSIPSELISLSFDCLSNLPSQRPSWDHIIGIIGKHLIQLKEKFDESLDEPFYDLFFAQELHTSLLKSSSKKDTHSHFLLGLQFLQVEKNASEAYKWISKAASKEHTEAQYWLGKMYKQGQGISKDSNKAKEYFKKAALKGHALAQVELAEMYFYGTLATKQLEKGEWWALRAASQQCIEAYFLMGCIAKEVHKNYKMAAYWLQKAAQKNHSEAQMMLSMLYQAGEGVPIHPVRENYWLERAKESHTKSQLDSHKQVESNLTETVEEKTKEEGQQQSPSLNSSPMIHGSSPRPRKYSVAKTSQQNDNFSEVFILSRLRQSISEKEKHKFLQHLCTNCDKQAFVLFFSSVVYRYGVYGIRVDEAMSSELLKKALLLKHELAEMEYSYFVDKNYKKAFEIASNLGNKNKYALFRKAVCLELGNGTTKDLQQSIALYQLSGQLNHIPALYNLGIIYSSEDFSEKCLQTSFQFFKKAAALGDVESMRQVADYYYFGIGVSKDLNAAFQAYEEAAEKGNGYCLYALGLFYEAGKFVDKNKQKAIFYFEKAAEENYEKAKQKLQDLR